MVEGTFNSGANTRAKNGKNEAIVDAEIKPLDSESNVTSKELKAVHKASYQT
jgi:hypothetical protein